MDLPQDFIDSNNAGVVLGLKSVAGVQTRVDIDQLLWNDPNAFNLFLLALKELQDPSMTNNIMGYFEIAGIHGMPRRAWDGVGHKQNLKIKQDAGYCAHSTETFPTWHRPYLAMFEQSLFVKMHEIANRFNEPHKAEYKNAAQRFRLPFWDYYRPRGGKVTFPGIVKDGLTSFPYDYSCPKVFTSPSIMVRMHPDNKLVKLEKNPLHSYEFEEGIMGTDWDTLSLNAQLFPRDRTVRYPRFDPKWKTGEETLNLVLNGLRMDSNRLALNIVGDEAYGLYDAFATDKKPGTDWPEDPTAAQIVKAWPSGSLESLHGLYHGLIGGNSIPRAEGQGGHMSRVATAAFDPVFWMHHAQIDRLFAIWQAVHDKTPGNWFSDPNKAKERLYPARKKPGNDDGSFWDSNDSKNTTIFGYTYPELVGTPEEVLAKFNAMYEWSVPLNDSLTSVVAPPDMEPIDVLKTQFFKFEGEPDVKAALLSEVTTLVAVPELEERVQTLALPALSEQAVVPEKEFSREWFIDDEIQRLALNGAFTIFYFIGTGRLPSVPDTDSDFALAPTLAGLNHVFAAPVQLCDNCGRQDEQAHIVTNTVAITSILLDFVEIGVLADLEPANVIPYLQKQLKWRILTINGDLVDPRELARNKGLKIGVSCKKARLPRGSGIVEYENYPEVIDTVISSASPTADSI